ncbi:prenyltransferase/squalene oxidase repeat-containing protein [Streptomyces sp. NPDC001941]|uniref:prenyltransferase/squalene oxidase repeat-containing protein n=1 Tax=Streptomyces sp. NPDC001941 TaxID=3154659 RepID=UPI00332692ED
MGNARGSARSGGRRLLALLCAAVTTVGGGALLLAQAAPAAADPLGACTATKGAVVAVDFGDWGGTVVRGCDATPTTGYDLLHEAGFTTAGTEHDGPAFICRLGHTDFDGGRQYPTPDKEACGLTPPAAAYWSYWTAPPGQDFWTYSPLGAMAHKPKDGSVEAWVYGGTKPGGGGGEPSFPPSAVRPGGVAPGDTPPVVPPGEVKLKDASAWLKTRLTNGTYVQDEGAEAPNYYQTAQTALALAAGEGGSATVEKMTRYLADHVEEFVYPQGVRQPPSVGNAALAALLAASTGRDPRDFGGHDVAGDLAGTVCTTGAGVAPCVGKGDFSDVGDVETQSLAVLALLRAKIAPPAESLARIAAHLCKDGGFSPTLVRDGDACTYGDPATTPYAMIALHTANVSGDAVARARKALYKAQLKTGAFGAYAGVETGDVGSTGRSAQVLRILGDTMRADAAVSWLSRQQTKAGGFGFDEGAADPEPYPTWAAVVAGARTSLATLTTKKPDPEPTPTPPPTKTPGPTTKPTGVPKPPWEPGQGPDVARATAFLTDGQRLRQGHYYENVAGTGFADFGLTIDGAYALAATGSDDATLRGVVDFLDQQGTDATRPTARTVNDWTGVGTSHAAGGSIGKLAVLAQSVGRDPRNFAGHDLVAALAGATCAAPSKAPDRSCPAKGAYRYAPSVFAQSLGVIAQQRAGETAAAAGPLAFLRSLQHASGAWPSLVPSTGDSEVDSTAMAAMALDLDQDAASRAAVDKALAWIASRQLADGGFPGASGNSVNSAGLAVQGLSLDAGKYGAQIRKARLFLKKQQNADGGFNVAADGQRGSDVRASTQALGGAFGTSFGTLHRDLSGTTPRPGSDDPAPAPSGGGSPNIVTPDGGSGDLAATGAPVWGTALAALVLTLAGCGTVVAVRRRGTAGSHR